MRTRANLQKMEVCSLIKEVNMFNQQHYPPAGGGGFPPPSGNKGGNYYEAIRGLAIVIAILTTVICAPYLCNLTDEWIEQFIVANYGESFVDIGKFIWDSLLYALVYYAAKAFLVGAIVTAGLTLATKMPMLAA